MEYTYLAMEVDGEFVTAGPEFVEVADECLAFWTQHETLGAHAYRTPCTNPSCVEEGLTHRVTLTTVAFALADLDCPMYWHGAELERLRLDWWEDYNEEPLQHEPADTIFILKRNVRPDARPRDSSRELYLQMILEGQKLAGVFDAAPDDLLVPPLLHPRRRHLH